VDRVYAGVFAMIGWTAVVGQYLSGHAGSLASTIDYFSYFTILSNVLVAATLTVAALAPNARSQRFLLRPTVLLAAVVYITVTGLTYYFLLAKLYHLAGWVLFYDRLLHYVMPPAFVLFWLLFVQRGGVGFGSATWVLVAPVVYAAYTFARGPLTGFYPYPFVDLPKIGAAVAVRNVAEFAVFFYLLAIVLVMIDRLMARLQRARGPSAAARRTTAGW
jgi:hypothetical protein